MKIVIPMAGRGVRTSNFNVPKPLIRFGDKTMIEMAVETLDIDGEYIFIQRDYQNAEWNAELEAATLRVVPDAKIIRINYVTEGPACTALLAYPHISMPDDNDGLIIANCDQIMRWDSSKFLEFAKNPNPLTGNITAGCVVTYPSDTPKNSYVKVDAKGRAIKFAEKEVISSHSLNGIHYWRRPLNFVVGADRMIYRNDRVNGEFYITPSYNWLYNFAGAADITIYEIPADQHFAVGTNEDIERYMSLHASV